MSIQNPPTRAGRRGLRVLQAARATIAPVLAGAAVCGAALMLGGVSAPQMTVRVDLEVSGGAVTELFLNEAAEPMRMPAMTGRRIYEFAGISEIIRVVRLDPVDASAVDIRLYGIDIVGPDGATLARYRPGVIQQWHTSGIQIGESTPDAIVMRSVDRDPMLIGQVAPVGAAVSGGVRAELVARLHRDPLLPYVLLLPLLWLIEIRPLGPWLLRAASAVAVIAAWPWVYHTVAGIDWGSTPMVVAVSRAAYQGHSLPTLQAAVAAASGAAGVLGLTLAFWRTTPTVPADEPAPANYKRFLVLACVAVGVLTVPDLHGRLAWIKSVHYTPHWDYDNILYWAYWTAHDRLPFRDFWYPYGGLFLFDLPWPAGPLIVWASTVARYAVFASALVLGSQGRPWSALVATAALMSAETAGFNFGAHRYLLGANVVLAYVAARRLQFRGWVPLVTLAVSLVMPLVFEPPQLAYAVPAVAAIALLDAMQQRRRNRIFQGAVFCAAVVTAGAILVVVALWSTGMLAAALAVYSHLGDAVQYSTLPAQVLPDPWPAFPVSSVAVWFPAVAGVVGLAEYRRRDSQAHVRAGALVGLAVLAFIVVQKHLVRPMPDTFVLYAFVTGLVFAVLSPSGQVSRDRLGVGAAVGLLIALMVFQGRGNQVLSAAAHLPARLTRTLGFLATPEASAEANRERFAPDRFSLYRQQRELVDQLTRRRRGPITVFALTDDPVVYLLTAQGPVWHANLYNGSPVYEQQRLINSLRDVPPDYVVAARGGLAFDEVPLAVRVPDIVEFVIANYVPDSPVGLYTVLRPRDAGEPVPLTFWQDLFGGTLDLAALPLLLAARPRAACVPTAQCDEVLVLVPQGPVTDTSAWIALTAGDLSVRLRVRLKPDRMRYVIPLSRLWPAAAARAAGLAIQASPPPGFTLERSAVARIPGRLY